VTETSTKPRRHRRRGFATAALLGLPTGWLIVFFVAPVILVILYSFGRVTILPAYDHGPGLLSWKTFFLYTDYMSLFWKSVRTSLTVSLFCVLFAFPVAYFLAQVAGTRKYTLLLLTIAPFLTSYLLRVLAMRVLLNPQGVIQSFLRGVGVLADDGIVKWMFNSSFAVHLVLIYVWVPFVALPIFVSLDALPHSLLEASNDLGASRWKTFWKVTFPMSIPGIIASFIFVFIPTIGEYITPQLVGGAKGYLFGNTIQSSFLASFDWQLGSAMGIFLVAVVALLIAVFGRYLTTGAVAE
jgi:ABC-type spermidine/putrescine transport system permease subunit I